jgi:hypothetical protein
LLIRAEGLVLRGTAANYHGKQMAQHLAHKLLGLPILVNEIEVGPTASAPPRHDNGEPT